MTKKSVKQDYIFRRTENGPWQLRIKMPGTDGRKARIFDRSLKTTDKATALDRATPHILAHRKWLLEDRERIAVNRALAHTSPDIYYPKNDGERDRLEGWLNHGFYDEAAKSGVFHRDIPSFQPGERKPRKDGGYTKCSKDGTTLVHYDSGHEIAGTSANTNTPGWDFQANTKEHRELRQLRAELSRKDPKDDLDERIVRAWIAAKSVPHSREIDARNNAVAVLQEVAPGRNFATYTRADVHALVAAWVARGCATETMKKLRGHLRGMINSAMDNARREEFPEIKENIFTGDYIPPSKVGRRAPPRLFTTTDHAVIMADLPNWPISTARLYLLGRTCGLRRGECWTIEAEETPEDDIRCMVVCDDPEAPGKNGFANRLLPIPDSLLPYLPERINGSLFKYGMFSTVKDMMKRIRAAMVAADLDTRGKTHHSLRHGVQSFLDKRKTGVDPKIVAVILGHVPEDLRGNEGDNQAIRSAKSIRFRYFHGEEAQDVLDALNLIKL